MDITKILKCVDHTLLSQTVTTKDIQELIDDAIKFGTASVCIPPSFVEMAKNYAGDKIKICTVIGFPNGYNTTNAKVFEATDAIAKGADEIDMVINLGYIKEKKFDDTLNEIKKVREVCQGKTLKVIIETCLLTEQEKVKLCKLVTESGADYIKTSTGFSTSGATKEDIELIRENIGQNIKIKASGGIKTLRSAQDYIELGCSRLGSSSIVKLAKEQNKE
ncbi:MAG: deoxyribose-phosphate aldolase [Clostridiales bacterium]|nr:deoxyribose-phosphate aldolase [Clostridiales bacterium]